MNFSSNCGSFTMRWTQVSCIDIKSFSVTIDSSLFFALWVCMTRIFRLGTELCVRLLALLIDFLPPASRLEVCWASASPPSQLPSRRSWPWSRPVGWRAAPGADSARARMGSPTCRHKHLELIELNFFFIWMISLKLQTKYVLVTFYKTN